MDLVVTVLVLTSAAIHPLRELWIKDDGHPEALTFAVILQFALFAALHTVVLGVDVRPVLAVWPLVLLSALGLFMYFFSVVATLRHGDFSIYYPIMRSSPLYVVVVSALVLGHRYSVSMLFGIALVLISAFFLQYKRGAHFLSDPRTLFMAVLAMIGHGTLTLADAEAMRTVEPMAFLLILYILFIPCSAVLFTVMKPPGRSAAEHLFGGWRKKPLRYFLAGFTSYVVYYLILKAFQLGGNVAAVSAVRQISIPLAVILGGMYLKEASMIGRLSWSVVLAIGVAVIILSR
ncbi:MAG: EamA family transporter [Acidiferrobacterales bacterium]